MEQNTLLHGSQLCIAVLNITLSYNDYGPAYTDTVGWLSVATNTMTHPKIHLPNQSCPSCVHFKSYQEAWK